MRIKSSCVKFQSCVALVLGQKSRRGGIGEDIRNQHLVSLFIFQSHALPFRGKKWISVDLFIAI